MDSVNQNCEIGCFYVSFADCNSPLFRSVLHTFPMPTSLVLVIEAVAEIYGEELDFMGAKLA